jgi:hypothetical protein
MPTDSMAIPPLPPLMLSQEALNAQHHRSPVPAQPAGQRSRRNSPNDEKLLSVSATTAARDWAKRPSTALFRSSARLGRGPRKSNRSSQGLQADDVGHDADIDGEGRLNGMMVGNGFAPRVNSLAVRRVGDVPEHLESSPLCPRHPKHVSGGVGWCPYHGRTIVRIPTLPL